MRVTFLACAALLLLAGCNQADTPHATPALGANVPLSAAGARDVPGSLVFRAPDLDRRPAPRGFYIPATIIYNGESDRFLNIDDAQKRNVANIVTAAFRQALGRHQRVVDAPGPGIVTLQLLITGIHRTVPSDLVAYDNALSPFIPVTDVAEGNIQAQVAGSIMLAGKFVDPSGKLLAGFEGRLSTASFDLPPNATPTQIAQMVVYRYAEEIATTVDQEVSVQRANGTYP